MILNLLKNFILALLLDAGAALAFDTTEAAPAVAVPQSCALPVAAKPLNLSDTGNRS